MDQPSTSRMASPSPSTGTIFEEVDDNTILQTLHCHSEFWGQLVTYKDSSNWNQVPTDLQNIITNLINFNDCPCGQSEMQQQHPVNHTPPTAAPTPIEARLANIEDSIAVLVASVNATPKGRTMVSRPAVKKMVLISPVAHGRENTIDLVRLALPDSRAKITGQRGDGPQYTFLEGDEKTIDVIQRTCPDGQFSLGGNNYHWIVNPDMTPCIRCGKGSLCQVEGVETICYSCLHPTARQTSASPHVPNQSSSPTHTPAPAPTPTQAPAPTPDSQRRQVNRARQPSAPRQPPAVPIQRRRQRQRGNGSGQHRPASNQRRQEPHQHRNWSNGYRRTNPPQRFIPPRMQSQDRWTEPNRQYQNWYFRDEQHWPSYASALRRPRPPPREFDWPELPRGRYAAPQPWYPEYY